MARQRDLNRTRERIMAAAQKEFAEHGFAGARTDAIARRLSISTVTVRNHSQRVLRKLGVHSRLAAVAHGYREGLIERESDSPPFSERR